MKMFSVLVFLSGVLILAGCDSETESAGKKTHEVRHDNTSHSMQHSSMDHGTVTNADALICPVSGDKIKPGAGVTYQQDGYEYTLCCASCVSEIRKNPEKYQSQGKKL